MPGTALVRVIFIFRPPVGDDNGSESTIRWKEAKLYALDLGEFSGGSSFSTMSNSPTRCPPVVKVKVGNDSDLVTATTQARKIIDNYTYRDASYHALLQLESPEY